MLPRDQVLQTLNLSPRTLDVLVADGIILELHSADGRVYPREQFSGTGIDGRFASLMGLFRKLDLDSGEIWWWLNEKLDELNGLSTLESLEQATTDESMAQLRFVATAHWEIRGLMDPSLERTDWLRYGPGADTDGVGDYTPKRRGGQHAS